MAHVTLIPEPAPDMVVKKQHSRIFGRWKGTEGSGWVARVRSKNALGEAVADRGCRFGGRWWSGRGKPRALGPFKAKKEPRVSGAKSGRKRLRQRR